MPVPETDDQDDHTHCRRGFGEDVMKLTETEITSRLAADFGGSLSFQPLAVGDDDQQRPVAFLASVAQLLPAAATPLIAGKPFAADQRSPMLDLLYHDPAGTARAKR